MEGALWFEARDALAGIADVAARYDSDGVDIYFLNDPAVGKNLSVSRHGREGKRGDGEEIHLCDAHPTLLRLDWLRS